MLRKSGCCHANAARFPVPVRNSPFPRYSTNSVGDNHAMSPTFRPVVLEASLYACLNPNRLALSKNRRAPRAPACTPAATFPAVVDIQRNPLPAAATYWPTFVKLPMNDMPPTTKAAIPSALASFGLLFSNATAAISRASESVESTVIAAKKTKDAPPVGIDNKTPVTANTAFSATPLQRRPTGCGRASRKLCSNWLISRSLPHRLSMMCPLGSL